MTDADMSLDVQQLLYAYMRGVFPMDQDGEVYWYDPDPRAIIPLDAFHVPRSLQRTLKKGLFEIRRDTAFTAVMMACARPAPGRDSTWISDEFIAAYTQLHQLGYAHSVETWLDGQLVGGIYGVAIRGLFAGESMFSRERDASKVALVHLVQHLRLRGFVLLDTQFMTEHLRRFGAVEISRREYQRQLAAALRAPVSF